jgi:hypothetical protein
MTKLPTSKAPQRGEPDVIIRERIKEKLSKVRSRGYLQEGTVLSLTSFFTVPKGEDDVRVVYSHLPVKSAPV